MRSKVVQLELRPCADVFNLAGERGTDGARAIAEMAEASRRERETRAWADKMQRKLSECPGFIGCHPPGVETPGTVAVQPGATDEALEFLKRRFHVGQVDWQKGLGMIIRILPRRKGVPCGTVRRRLAPAEQFQFGFGISQNAINEGKQLPTT